LARELGLPQLDSSDSVDFSTSFSKSKSDQQVAAPLQHPESLNPFLSVQVTGGELVDIGMLKTYLALIGFANPIVPGIINSM
jgi:hypothetical protein